MELSADAIRQIEQDLLAKADILAYYLKGLSGVDASRAKAALGEIAARLEVALGSDGNFDSVRRRQRASSSQRSGTVVTERTPDIENFIIDSLTNNPLGLSVQDLVDRLAETAIQIKRPTLVVRLHRMLKAGKLKSRTHGHYVLNESEDRRSQSA
jgi:hypothetical protein